jgi:acyl dehydratase
MSNAVNVGDVLKPFTITAKPEAMKEWAVFLHDPNPIHLDVEVVKAKGLGDRVINQGPANVAYMMNMLLENFPDGSIQSMNSRFVDNVYGGDEVISSGTVTQIDKTNDGSLVHCEISLMAGERAVLTGTATVQL